MHINPYLNFNGQCEAAFKFYHQCLGGELGPVFTFGASPMADQIPKESHHLVMHTRLTWGDHVLMGSDCPPHIPHVGIAGCSVSIVVDNPAEADRIYNALSANGTVKMPIQETFWALRFGMFTDQFGVPWMVNCEKQNIGATA